MSKAQQTLTGIVLSLCVIAAWAAVHIGSVFWLSIDSQTAILILPIMMLQTWLGAGLFIVAHDAMHGSLSPGVPSLNRWVGTVALGLYAFFPYRSVVAKHMAHHAHSGRVGDPDFCADHPSAFWPWYLRFFREYFGWRQLSGIALTVAIYYGALHAHLLNIIFFWALPAIASSVQLFLFGTWLPHRHHKDAFCDRHNARSLDYGWLTSLAACYHFGYHIDHHCSPQTPWWALPTVRAQRLSRAPLPTRVRP